MITEKELRKVNKLRDKIDIIREIIEARKNEHVRSTFGICNLYQGQGQGWNSYGPNDDSSIKYFQTNHQEFMDKINEFAFAELEKVLDEYVKQYREIVKPEKAENER